MSLLGLTSTLAGTSAGQELSFTGWLGSVFGGDGIPRGRAEGIPIESMIRQYKDGLVPSDTLFEVQTETQGEARNRTAGKDERGEARAILRTFCYPIDESGRVHWKYQCYAGDLEIFKSDPILVQHIGRAVITRMVREGTEPTTGQGSVFSGNSQTVFGLPEGELDIPPAIQTGSSARGTQASFNPLILLAVAGAAFYFARR